MRLGRRSTPRREAVAVACDECEAIIATTCDPVPWDIRNSRGMHEKGTGHRPYYLTFAEYARLLPEPTP